MKPKNENLNVNNLGVPSVFYESSKVKFKGIDRATFDFDEEVRNGYTPEEFKAEMHKRIQAYPLKK
jgi:hypothetical protein